ncbi:MAG TPA: hypothetical protein VLM80_00845, partial [Anaerolineales bacterium]|nr:hypothetical protein [Anaerolineales bacterium]
MTTTFTCLSCGAPLDLDPPISASIRCPYCKQTVIVPAELRREEQKPAGAEASSSQAPVQINFSMPVSEASRQPALKISPKNTRNIWIAVGVFVFLMLCVSLAPLLAMPAIFTSSVKLVENLDPAAELASGGV